MNEKHINKSPLPCGGVLGVGKYTLNQPDIQRYFYLESQNFRILRFCNNEILVNLEGVMCVIKEVLGSSADFANAEYICESTHPLTPSAREGGQESSSLARDTEIEKAHPLSRGACGVVSIINNGECVESPRIKEGESQSSLRFAGFSDKWQEFRLGDLLQYEQPTKYIVKNTEYSDSYQTPVLTAGKSFILGKTNETFGVYDDLPIILFDDFMATSQFVDFPFKVKSSASKILKAKNNSVNLRVVFEIMRMIDFCAENHKRYWISEYQNLKIKLPTLAEQKKIAQVLSVCDKEIETLNLKFECLKAQKKGLMQQLLSGKVRVTI